MRVIAGKKKGTKLYSLDGMDTRPTLDRLKQSVFSMIQYETDNNKCLDLYAGSGALGIEAISRGFNEADFVDCSKAAIGIVKKNLKKTGFDSLSRVHIKSADDFLNDCDSVYDLVFLDPPYNRGLIVKPIEIMLHKNLLSDGALIVIEHSANERLDELDRLDGIYKYKNRLYGNKSISIYRRVI